MQLYQIFTIARYEFRMQWRRRALLVVTLAMLVVAGLSVILTRSEVMAEANVLTMTESTSTTAIIGVTFVPIGAVLAMIMPFALSDIIPRDRQLGVRELLDSTALMPATYLAGKVLGGWLCVLASLLVVIAPTGILWWVLVGAFNLGEYLAPWIIGALSMLVINIGLAVLLNATQPNARRAIVVTVVFFVLMPGIIGLDSSGTLTDIFNPLRPGVFFYYSRIVDTATYPLLSVGATIAGGVAQLGLVWLVAWAWLRRSDA